MVYGVSLNSIIYLGNIPNLNRNQTKSKGDHANKTISAQLHMRAQSFLEYILGDAPNGTTRQYVSHLMRPRDFRVNLIIRHFL